MCTPCQRRKPGWKSFYWAVTVSAQWARKFRSCILDFPYAYPDVRLRRESEPCVCACAVVRRVVFRPCGSGCAARLPSLTRVVPFSCASRSEVRVTTHARRTHTTDVRVQTQSQTRRAAQPQRTPPRRPGGPSRHPFAIETAPQSQLSICSYARANVHRSYSSRLAPGLGGTHATRRLELGGRVAGRVKSAPGAAARQAHHSRLVKSSHLLSGARDDSERSCKPPRGQAYYTEHEWHGNRWEEQPGPRRQERGRRSCASRPHAPFVAHGGQMCVVLRRGTGRRQH